MDPLSITTTVIGLVAQTVKSVQTIQNYVSKFRIADLTIASTRTECSTIRIALLQIQSLLTRNGSTSEVDSDNTFTAYALEEYEAVLGACSTAFSVLNERLEMMNLERLDEYSRSSFKAKFKAVWNDDEVALLRQNIRGQAIAINLLLSAFQAESSAKTYQLLRERKNQSALHAVSDDARTLLAKSHRARTITQRTIDDNESSGSINGDEVFDFDDMVINSAAYRRAYRQYNSHVIKTSSPEVEKSEEMPSNNQIPMLKPESILDFLVFHDEYYFESQCEELCQRVNQWALRFSKISDMTACRLTVEIPNDKTIDRLDNIVLDGSDVDTYLADSVQRRDVFMSMMMTMIWEFIFTKYLFGMDREQRLKLKSLETTLLEVGPRSAVGFWRATTLTLLSKRESYLNHTQEDLESVCDAILQTLYEILPPPSHLEQQLKTTLAEVLGLAAKLSVEMRTQRAEYIMLPPLIPEYDTNGDLVSKVSFNVDLMNERSGMYESNKELASQGAIVRMVLFPLIVKKGKDDGSGDDEIVVCPSQVLVAKPLRKA